MLGIFLHTLDLALYWTDFAFASGVFLLWIDVQKRRSVPAKIVDERELIRQSLWKQEEPLLGITWGCLLALAVTQFSFFWNHYRVRTILRNVIFLILLFCLIWLMVIQIRRDFGKSSRETQEEIDSLRTIRESAGHHRQARKERRAKKKPK